MGFVCSYRRPQRAACLSHQREDSQRSMNQEAVHAPERAGALTLDFSLQNPEK